MAIAVPGVLTVANMSSFQSFQTEVIFLFRIHSMLLVFVKETVCNITIGVI
jgi:hypothetical protein